MDSNQNSSRKNLLKQAGILAIAGFISRIIGLLYRGPLTAIIGKEGNGYYSGAYSIYTIILLVSSYSIPSAMAKIVSQKLAVKEYRNAHKIFKCALIYVTVAGLLGSIILFFGANIIATEGASEVIRYFAPTIFFYGFLGVLRGYFQAHRTMVPTSVSQLIEQLLNAIVSVGAASVLVNMAGQKDATKRAVYGAIGSSLGTGAGVLIALVFMLLIYLYNRETIGRRIRNDYHMEMSTSEAFRMIFFIVTPFVLSTCIYNLSSSLNYTVFCKIMEHFKHLEEDEFHGLYGLYAGQALVITNLPIALSSAAASAMIPEISSDIARGDRKRASETISKVMRIILMISIPSAVGLFALAKPVMMILFPQPGTLDHAAIILMVLSVTVIFYSLSTVTNAVLQGIGKVNVPVWNASAALVVQTIVLVVLLFTTNLNEYALCIAAIVYSLMMCILNNMAMDSYIKFDTDIRKTYILPSIAAIAMGVVAFLTHKAFSVLLGFIIPRAYFVNIIATVIAIVVAALTYFLVLIQSGGATEDDICGLPKGRSLARMLKKIHFLR